MLPSPSTQYLKMEEAGHFETSVTGVHIQDVTVQETAISIVKKALELYVIVKDHASDIHRGTTGL